MNSYSCGQQYSHTCPICMEDYDGEGAEVATCSLDYEICYDGVCGIVATTGVWKAALSMQSRGLNVQFTSGLEGAVHVTFTSDPINGNLCFMTVNGADCACVMRNCGDPNNPDLIGAYADCTSLGQGILDVCDTENGGSPGDMLRFLNLPDTCDLGGEAGASTTGSDAAAAATTNATDIAKLTQPMSGTWAKSTAMWMMSLGVLFYSFSISP